ncbi:MAG: hypothetical protein WAM91_04055 [Candidatus Acidiferrales bacterium]
MESLDRKFRLTFLNASDGPRIMLFGPMDVDIGALQQVFRQLSRECGQVQLDQQQFVVPFRGIQVLAKCSGSVIDKKSSGNRQGIFRRQDNPSHFEWTRSAEGWDYLAELIDGLAQSQTAGHQYLTHYPGEDAIVVLSKGEYSDSVLSQ